MKISTLTEIKNNKNWQFFSLKDSYNANFIDGYINIESGDEYGNMLFEKVNGEKCLQYIVGTPKLAYPFDQIGHWYFPPAIQILRFRKYDGTNILQYCYQDSNKNFFTSYKLRLRPFITNSKWGNFFDMWNEMLTKYPHIKNLARIMNSSVAFELWGARNLHLIKYDKELECSLLFFRDKNGAIKPSIDKITACPTAEFLGEIASDWIWNYQNEQTEMNTKLIKNSDETFSGEEGEVWYCQLKSNVENWFPLKCKPAQIEQIHWEQKDSLNKFVIRATIQNAFESFENPTVEDICSLLHEEYEEDKISKMEILIKTELAKFGQALYFKQQVLEEYKNLGLNILDNKAKVLRQLTQKFGKEKSREVYSIVMGEKYDIKKR